VAIWLTERQNLQRRIIAQKMGIVYSLPDYFTNNRIIKTASDVDELANV